ncbi:four-helix bundle copper-binding protein [Frankia sp. AgPm24]|uniref:Four-helix bundle copper-binding protein n=1 Tax=Frankia umida TaxID=573489 RepID=A0ABT0JUQ1_9ACTN|nr:MULTISPECIES: four-helix bundle copper-binding protein [Frankia]MCK9875278.1 four-helix bundle copper-binding protein [Frankia umida]MCK9924812.1 four-helix bundle copper-binding protein [Frankia sp. AgPm24]
MQHAEKISETMRKAIDECMSCSTLCEETISYCMDMPGSMMDAADLRLMMDCAAITRTCADMMCRMSPMRADMCAMCARICGATADMCEKMPRDAQLTRLARACRSCMDSCTAMAGAAA